MRYSPQLAPLAVALGLGSWGCADWDNPTALADLAPEVEFEIEAARVETLDEVAIHVHITENGAPLRLLQSQMEIHHEVSGSVQLVNFENEGDGYAAHVRFFHDGEHELRFLGMPVRHALMVGLGEHHEIQVYNQHAEIGPYWVELEVPSGPLYQGGTSRLRLLTYELLAVGTRGDPIGGLDIEAAIHAPDGIEVPLTLANEGPGEYEAEYTFGDPGTYELHVEIGIDGALGEGEFHIPVLMPDADDGGADDHGGSGGGHDH